MIAKQLAVLALGVGVMSTANASTAVAKVLTPEAPIEVSAKAARFDLMTVDAAEHRLLAAHSHAHKLTVVGLPAGKSVREIPVGESAGVAVDAIDNKYFVGTERGVVVVDRKSLKKIDTIATPGPADAVIFDPQNDRLYAGHDDGKALWVIDAKKNERIGRIVISGAPELMAIDTKAHRLFLNIKPRDEVVDVDTDADKILHHWSTLPAKSPHGLVLDAKSQQLFIGGRSTKLTVLSTTTGHMIRSIDIGPGDHVDQMVYDPQYHRLYFPDHGRLVVLDTQATSNPMLAALAIPVSTHSVTLDPKTHDVWIAYADEGHSYVQAFQPGERK